MLKRTKGLLLLSLLVVTGLAGALNDPAITSRERKVSANLMKETKAELIKSVKGLSEAQLNYKPAADRWSVKECAYHLAVTEKALWQLLEMTMKAPANPEKRAEIKVTDEDLVKMVEDRSEKRKTSEMLEPKNAAFKSLDEAMTEFKTLRTDHIKYIKTTTEDLRNHVAQMPFGWIDCYQLTLMISAHTNRHTKQLNEVKADPGFPKQ
ncbi:MAG TPA: DinB family protein [Chitinophagaceae bacterium]